MKIDTIAAGKARLELTQSEELYVATEPDGPTVTIRRGTSGIVIVVDSLATDMKMEESENQFVFSFFTA